MVLCNKNKEVPTVERGTKSFRLTSTDQITLSRNLTHVQTFASLPLRPKKQTVEYTPLRHLN
jgi:hypothetical protein